MIERVHEHLIGELKQNTRTDTIFIIVAIILNVAVLGTNSAIGGLGTGSYEPEITFTEGSHKLYVEVLGDEGWQSAGSSEVTIKIVDRLNGSDRRDTGIWHIPRNSANIRYQLDSDEWEGWAEPIGERPDEVTQTLVMYIFILLAVFVNLAVILGLLRGKNMRMVLLDGLIRMYRDQKVESYYDQGLLKSYSIRYYIFISVVVFLGVIAIVVPLVIRYL